MNCVNPFVDKYDFDPYSSTRRNWARGWRERAVEAVVLQHRDVIVTAILGVRSMHGDLTSIPAIRNVIINPGRVDLLLFPPGDSVLLGEAKQAEADDLDSRTIRQLIKYCEQVRTTWDSNLLSEYKAFALLQPLCALDTARKSRSRIGIATAIRPSNEARIDIRPFIAVNGHSGDHKRLEHAIEEFNALHAPAEGIALVLVQPGQNESERRVNGISFPGGGK
jgi:hypothetical protein